MVSAISISAGEATAAPSVADVIVTVDKEVNTSQDIILSIPEAIVYINKKMTTKKNIYINAKQIKVNAQLTAKGEVALKGAVQASYFPQAGKGMRMGRLNDPEDFPQHLLDGKRHISKNIKGSITIKG